MVEWHRNLVLINIKLYTTHKKATINRDNAETLCIITKMGIALQKKRNNLKWDYSAHENGNSNHMDDDSNVYEWRLTRRFIIIYYMTTLSMRGKDTIHTNEWVLTPCLNQ